MTKKTEDEVLAVYRKENPSTYFTLESEQRFNEVERQRRNLFRDVLKLPTQIFKGAELIDFGAGTGEYTVMYNRWGANCTGIDANEISIGRAKEVFNRYQRPNSNNKLIVQSIFDFPYQNHKHAFDIVVSDGVLHHTGDYAKGFDIISNCLKPGGFLVLGMANASGWFQRGLQRALLYHLSTNEEDIVSHSEMLFKENLDRAEKYGLRSRMAVIYDSYVNPKVHAPTTDEMITCFTKNGLHFYSSAPAHIPPIFSDAPQRQTFNPGHVQGLATIGELFMAAHTADDKDVAREQLVKPLANLTKTLNNLMRIISDVTPSEPVPMKDLSHWLKDLVAQLQGINPLQEALAQAELLFNEAHEAVNLAAKKDLGALSTFCNSTKELFRGTNGVGMNYYVGYRPE